MRVCHGGHELGMRARLRRSVVGQFLYFRRAAPAHEIVLEVEPSVGTAHARAHAVIAHGQDARADIEPPAEIVGDARERLARRVPARALDVGCKVAVAEPEPGRPAEPRERRHEVPGFVTPPPALVRIANAGERVHERVEIGRDREIEMLEVVPGVGDDDQPLGRHDAAQAERELGAADPAGERHDGALWIAPDPPHRNRSSSGGRTSECPALAGAVQARPRTSTTGTPSAAWPMTSDAAAAISSAKPTMVVCKVWPNRSGFPRRSTAAGRPAAPSAPPTVPRRHARPKLSLMITASAQPNRADNLARRVSADASGSRGSKSTRSRPSGALTLE